MRAHTACLLSISFLMSLMPALSSHATDGVLEINQSCAVDTGCFAGDLPGFPVTIASRGGYILTGSLAPPGPAMANVIEINADSVTLDLNGFSLLGGTSCSQTGTIPNVISCVAGGNAANGITGTAGTGVTIRNGRIGGMQFNGIGLSSTASVRVEDVTIGNCAAACLNVGPNSSVMGASAGLCGLQAIQVGDNSAVENSVALSSQTGIGLSAVSSVHSSSASGNEGPGVSCGGACRINDVRASSNGTHGISIFGGASVVSKSISILNGDDGIHETTGNGSILTENIVQSNVGDGIEAADGSTVLNNIARGNDTGLRLGTETAYAGNTISNNTTATVIDGFETGPNLCNGNTTCP